MMLCGWEGNRKPGAAYRRVDDLVTCRPVHWNQLRAQRSVTSMGSLYLLPFYLFLLPSQSLCLVLKN